MPVSIILLPVYTIMVKNRSLICPYILWYKSIILYVHFVPIIHLAYFVRYTYE